MADILIEKSGPYSSVQDGGRPGYQGLGIPTAGAVDRLAWQVGNALVGNAPEAVGIEIFLGEVELRALSDSVIALTGTHKEAIEIAGTCYPAGQALRLKKGQSVHVLPLRESQCVFLAIQGGIDVPLLYGSASTSPAAKIGGHEGRLLANGDRLSVAPKKADASALNLPAAGLFIQPERLRILPGPHDGWFQENVLALFCSTAWKITPQISRMGMRLAQPNAEAPTLLQHRFGADLLSEGSVIGVIQVPKDGQPIIMLANHGTTGGYTKMGHVISADLDGVARLRPGQTLYFETTDLATAEQAARSYAAATTKLIAEISQAPRLG